MNSQDAYRFSLLALAIWREARGEPLAAKLGVGWVIKNRVNSSRFKQWGLGWDGVILHKSQFSSFNTNDANASKIPPLDDPSMADSIKAAEMVFNGNGLDNTGGAHYYYDVSMDKEPPAWATSGEAVFTVDIGRFHFYRSAR